MSDEPSDAQKLIAEVLRSYAVERCTCEICVDIWSKGAAAEVDKALGGLTQEWATEFDSWYRNPRGEKRDYVEHFDYKGDEHSARDHVRTSKGVRLVTRFASGWTVTE